MPTKGLSYTVIEFIKGVLYGRRIVKKIVHFFFKFVFRNAHPCFVQFIITSLKFFYLKKTCYFGVYFSLKVKVHNRKLT